MNKKHDTDWIDDMREMCADAYAEIDVIKEYTKYAQAELLPDQEWIELQIVQHWTRKVESALLGLNAAIDALETSEPEVEK